jgi:hypothetical protein
VSLNSFRLKLALLSGLFTGLLLVGTGVGLWRIAYQFNLNRLDREILNLGQGNLDREQGPAHYQRFEGALAFISGEDPPRSTLILVRDQQGKVIFASHHWPTNLNAASFPPLTGPFMAHRGPPRAVAEPPPQWPPPLEPPDRHPPPRDEPPLPTRVPRFETRLVNGQPWRFGIMGNPFNTLVLGFRLCCCWPA